MQRIIISLRNIFTDKKDTFDYVVWKIQFFLLRYM